MSDVTATGLDNLAGAMLQEVLRRTHLSTAPDLATVVAEEGRTISADPLVLYLLDHEQSALVPVPGPGTITRAPLAVQGTVAGRAFASSSIIDLDADGGGRRVWLPLVDGTERLGVASMTFADRDGPLPADFVALCERYAHLIATLISNKDLYSDFFKRLRRRQSMTMASELLWDLVPPHVLATDTFMLAAILEPCYDIGGDAYDYAVNDGGVLHFAVFDAMGHGLAAAGATAFALSAYRQRRRHHDRPAAMYAAIDAAIFEQYPQTRFATAVIAELERRGRPATPASAPCSRPPRTPSPNGPNWSKAATGRVRIPPVGVRWRLLAAPARPRGRLIVEACLEAALVDVVLIESPLVRREAAA